MLSSSSADIVAEASRPSVEIVSTPSTDRLGALREVLDSQAARYAELRDAADLRAYLGASPGGADEELLTEPVLARILEQVLGFPPDGYFPQLQRGGQKPDFTPIDLIAHPFVLDSKSSSLDLAPHEHQIRRYMKERSLSYGVVFNLVELRVYKAGIRGNDPSLSFRLQPLWEVARGEALPGDEVVAFEAFCDLFSHRTLSVGDKIDNVRAQRLWSLRLDEEELEVDVEALVERLRRLSRMLADDAGAQFARLDEHLRLNPGRERKLVEELETLALDIAPGTSLGELPDEVAVWRTSPGLPQRAWGQYLLRVAYLALTRIMLYRAWEDVEFVTSYLYDGGFNDAYERLSHSVRDVLKAALAEGGDRYRWLYGPDNNYDWYRPGEAELVEVIYLLAPIPLGKLDADVLGGLYVSYVDEIDRDRRGQFFTPRDVVRFMLDRVGFTGPAGVFRLEGDDRKPRRVLDFATGSGGFLVEAARRIIDDGQIDDAEPRDLVEALTAIARGLVGGEISPFPYYLTEVNLLLQVSRLLGRLKVAGADPPRFVLGPLHVDTLTAKSAPDVSLEGLDPQLRADRAELVQDERFDLVPLDGEKLETFRELRAGSFDLVVGNPPYVTEANNKPLFARLRAIPAWKGIYRGKTDYSYYFVLLAIEKLAPGGRICVITPAGWMNAGAADFLREKLASELTLDELFLFGSYKLFAAEQGPAPTPTVESAILVATKAAAPPGHILRVVALEDEEAAGRPERVALLDEMVERAKGTPGRSAGIHVHDVPQEELVPQRPWPVKFAAQDAPARAVAHLQGLLDDEAGPVEPLGTSWHVFQGIQTGADAYTVRIQRRLSAQVRQALAARGAATGDPILELPAGFENREPWRDHPDVLARSIEPRAIMYGALDESDYTSLVRLTRANDPPRAIVEALEPWREVLATRAEIVRNPRRRWWETAWPRDGHKLAAPKVIALHRTDRGRFAVDETGVWRPSIKTTLVVGKDENAPVAYLCGLLNSELLDLWYGLRGRVPRDIWRDYEPRPMNEIPYRRPDGDPRADQIARFVRRIATNRVALLPHRAVFPALVRVVKDPWNTGPVALDAAALIEELPSSEKLSLRIDPNLTRTGDGKPGRPVRESDALLRLGRLRVTGEPERIDLLERVLGGRAPESLDAALLPSDLVRFEELAAEREQIVGHLLAEGRRLVEDVERLVCELYDVPSDLTEAIVEHAVERASASP
jgi:hypothetical protein